MASKDNTSVSSEECECEEKTEHTSNCYNQVKQVNLFNCKHSRPLHTRGMMQVFCANCGALGHMYRSCNQPIISYGVICFKIENGVPKYLMVQRKDSLAYVEFVRGKYNLNVRDYILELLALMTETERINIVTKPFDVIWQEMWCKKICDENKNFGKEFKEANDKFTTLKKGYYIKGNNDELEFFSLQHAYRTTTPKFEETEWGFPKGRRNINEDDISCALREFKEETGVSPKHLHLCTNYIKPFDEVFSGSNKVRYKHVYYIARLTTDFKSFAVNPNNKQQCKEIRNIEWFTYEEAQTKLRDYNIERKELLKRINHVILKTKRFSNYMEDGVIQTSQDKME